MCLKYTRFRRDCFLSSPYIATLNSSLMEIKASSLKRSSLMKLPSSIILILVLNHVTRNFISLFAVAEKESIP